MIQSTETEVQTGINVMRVMVTGWTSELYSYILSHLYVVGIILICVLLIFIIHTLKSKNFARKAKHIEIVSTNDWFSWEEFKTYEKNQKNKT